MNPFEFNDCSEHLINLENLLAENVIGITIEIAKKKSEIIEKNNYLADELFAEKYLADYAYYLNNLLRIYKIKS